MDHWICDLTPQVVLDADQVINSWSEDELADLIFRYGEEPASRRIARAIVNARPIRSTRHLAEIIERIVPRQRSIHPATRTFQALRITINRELDGIKQFLPMALQSLASGGCLAIISFHSLEDRLVKEFFRQESRDCLCPPRQPICTCGHKATIIEVNRRPITPSPEEINGKQTLSQREIENSRKKIMPMGVGSVRRCSIT